MNVKIELDGPDRDDPQTLLLAQLFSASVGAAMPAVCLAAHLPAPATGRTVIVGAGKAADEMVAVAEKHFADATGGVTLPMGSPARTGPVDRIFASHPVPSRESERAARRSLDLVAGLTAQDLVICLMSGGASSLWALPPDGVDLGALANLTRSLLKSGAPIDELNIVRKHLSLINGGRLGVAATPATVVCFAISDVPNDDPGSIGSGPTIGDASTLADARAVLAAYDIDVPAQIAQALRDPKNESPAPDDTRLADTSFTVIANSATGLDAAARVARHEGLRVVDLGGDLQGEARDLGRAHARLAERERARGGACAILSGGETSVTVTGAGQGGRNSEYLLALVGELENPAGIYGLACDTDGIDGISEYAGAVFGPATMKRARAARMSATTYLDNNDSLSFFERAGGRVRTGPTGTNINDFRAILVT